MRLVSPTLLFGWENLGSETWSILPNFSCLIVVCTGIRIQLSLTLKHYRILAPDLSIHIAAWPDAVIFLIFTSFTRWISILKSPSGDWIPLRLSFHMVTHSSSSQLGQRRLGKVGKKGMQSLAFLHIFQAFDEQSPVLKWHSQVWRPSDELTGFGSQVILVKWTDYLLDAKLTGKLGRGWCRLSQGTVFHFSTSVTTELCDRIWQDGFCYNSLLI